MNHVSKIIILILIIIIIIKRKVGTDVGAWREIERENFIFFISFFAFFSDL